MILHFNILEKYPPALNLIKDVLIQKPEYKISVITSINSSSYKDEKYIGVKILRLGSVSENSIIRYSSYLIYNILGAIFLLLIRPEKVLVFETLSIFPAYIYSIIFPQKTIHIHYHEYISNPEKEASSSYMKFLFKCEDKLLNKYTCSQTNEDRKELFLKNHTYLKSENVAVYPNTPPRNWWSDWGQHKDPWKGGKIKLVYVGVLDLETMFLKETLSWVKENPNDLELTFFSQQYSIKTMELINSYSAKNIFLKRPKYYYELPQELSKYDIGLVLYNGHIPNYVYNVPNKVFEYLYSGIKVLSDICLYSVAKLNSKDIMLTEFKHIQKCELSILKDFLSLNNLKTIKSNEYPTLIEQI